MKTSIIILFVLLSQVCIGQIIINDKPKIEDKKDYSYILIYRTWDQGWKQFGDHLSQKSNWTTHIEGFNSLKELLGWVNIIGWDGKPKVRISENEFIAIYDLVKAGKIELKLKTENKSLPKRIEIEEEKWTETSYEIK